MFCQSSVSFKWIGQRTMIKTGLLLVASILAIRLVRAEEGRTNDPFRFGLDLYTAVHEEQPSRNVIISPLSIQIALGLLFMGASGATAEAIMNGLYLKTSEKTKIAGHFHDLLDRHGDENRLKIANKIFAHNDYAIDPAFKDIAQKSFGSEVESINLGDVSSAVRTINAWVERNTNRKIKDLFSADNLHGDSQMVLVNAIHFKSPWKTPFYKSSTRSADFWISDTKAVKVEMMFGDIHMRYGENSDLDAKIAMIPYYQSNLTMMVIVPKSRNGLADLEDKLQSYDISMIPKTLSRGNVEMLLPKFRVESSVNLEGVFKKMGMGDLFSNAAEFPFLLASRENLKIDSAVHKAYIAVDEDGTEAAAATGINPVPLSEPPRIEVNHPFFFAIMGPQDVLFVGSVRKL